MTRLSSGFLCSNSICFSPKRFFGVFTKLFFTFVSERPAVFGMNGYCFRKGSVDGPPNDFCSSSPNGYWFIKGSLEDFANCPLHFILSLFPGSKFIELWTSQPYKSSPQKKLHHVLAVDYSFTYICVYKRFENWRFGARAFVVMPQETNKLQRTTAQRSGKGKASGKALDSQNL